MSETPHDVNGDNNDYYYNAMDDVESSEYMYPSQICKQLPRYNAAVGHCSFGKDGGKDSDEECRNNSKEDYKYDSEGDCKSHYKEHYKDEEMDVDCADLEGFFGSDDTKTTKREDSRLSKTCGNASIATKRKRASSDAVSAAASGSLGSSVSRDPSRSSSSVHSAIPSRSDALEFYGREQLHRTLPGSASSSVRSVGGIMNALPDAPRVGDVHVNEAGGGEADNNIHFHSRRSNHLDDRRTSSSNNFYDVPNAVDAPYLTQQQRLQQLQQPAKRLSQMSDSNQSHHSSNSCASSTLERMTAPLSAGVIGGDMSSSSSSRPCSTWGGAGWGSTTSNNDNNSHAASNLFETKQKQQLELLERQRQQKELQVFQEQQRLEKQQLQQQKMSPTAHQTQHQQQQLQHLRQQQLLYQRQLAHQHKQQCRAGASIVNSKSNGIYRSDASLLSSSSKSGNCNSLSRGVFADLENEIMQREQNLDGGDYVDRYSRTGSSKLPSTASINSIGESHSITNSIETGLMERERKRESELAFGGSSRGGRGGRSPHYFESLNSSTAALGESALRSVMEEDHDSNNSTLRTRRAETLAFLDQVASFTQAVSNRDISANTSEKTASHHTSRRGSQSTMYDAPSPRKQVVDFRRSSSMPKSTTTTTCNSKEQIRRGIIARIEADIMEKEVMRGVESMDSRILELMNNETSHSSTNSWSTEHAGSGAVSRTVRSVASNVSAQPSVAFARGRAFHRGPSQSIIDEQYATRSVTSYRDAHMNLDVSVPNIFTAHTPRTAQREPYGSSTMRMEAIRRQEQPMPGRYFPRNDLRSDTSHGELSSSIFDTRPQVDRHHRSREVISNIEALASRREAELEGGSVPTNDLPNSFLQDNTTGREQARGYLGPPSREVIASMETDIAQLEEEEESNMQQESYYGLPNRHMVLGPYGSSVRSNSLQRRHPPEAARYSLADQICNLAITDDHDENASVKSIDSSISYDGKTTNIFALGAQTHEQEFACHELHDAISDLYGAPVGRVLKEFPMVTRFIRSDDDSGNIQLHYAVRNGNVKAMRRILRVDPACALIRNNQGFCPLHFAVQIGNFAAVQVLCSMVPASAEVQCEEGNLPLHEAVSSAAHHADAPQITAVLINAFPSAIKITNDEGLLPLHLAAMSGFSGGIRTIFAYGFSTIYARENTEDMLPLDFAVDGYFGLSENDDSSETDDDAQTNVVIENNGHVQLTNQHASQTVMSVTSASSGPATEKHREFCNCIDTLLTSALYDRPVLTSLRNARMFLPIHGAAASQPCRRNWKRIYKMYGARHAGDVDVRGQTALHILVSSKIFDPELVSEMVLDIQKYVDSTNIHDDSGLTPLHAALVNNAPRPVVERLLECNGSSVTTEVDEDCDRVQFREMLPFQLAAACGCNEDIINLLIRAYPIGVAGAIGRS